MPTRRCDGRAAPPVPTLPDPPLISTHPGNKDLVLAAQIGLRRPDTSILASLSSLLEETPDGSQSRRLLVLPPSPPWTLRCVPATMNYLHGIYCTDRPILLEHLVPLPVPFRTDLATPRRARPFALRPSAPSRPRVGMRGREGKGRQRLDSDSDSGMATDPFIRE